MGEGGREGEQVGEGSREGGQVGEGKWGRVRGGG